MDFIKHDETPLFNRTSDSCLHKIKAPEVLTDVALLWVEIAHHPERKNIYENTFNCFQSSHYKS
ncbi:hypothetical protein CHD54_14215 [Salmonella enterica]|nr:hypothetical protein CHD54_14215 [Salmonella enterica]